MEDENAWIRMDDAKLKEIGQRIGNARKVSAISSTKLAEYIGVSPNQMSRIENGKVPAKIEYLYILPQILNVSADELLYGEKTVSDYKEITNILNRLNDKELEIAKNVLKAVFG